MNQYFKNIYRAVAGSLSMRVAAAGIAFMASTGLLSAAPASGCPVKMTAPDGREVWVVAVGDENSRHFETLDGRVVEWLPKVEQKLAVKPLSLKSINARMKGVGRAAQSGGSRFLVVLVDFPDRPFTTANAADVFTRMMTGDDFNDNGACGSAKQYYAENSDGAFVPEFDIVGPVTMTHNAAYYASVGLDDSPATKMVIEACQQLGETLDFNDYDLDGNGVCDNVYFFYAGMGQADGGGSTTIWPHSATLGDFGQFLIVDGVKIENYACSPELSGSGRLTGIGTFCHEFCHVLGLPDLYYSGVMHPGAYSLMASGNYNNGGHTPPALSSYERYALGWIEPEEIAESGVLTLPDLLSSNAVRIIPTERENEYFLLENRQQQGWDYYLPGHGMIVWHIDYDRTAWDNNVPNKDRYHQRVDLVEANGATSGSPSKAWTFPGMNNVTAFDETTTPALRSWAGKSTGVGLSDITENADGTVSMYAAVESSALIALPGDCAERTVTDIFTTGGHRLSPEASLQPGIYIRRYADGTSEKFVVK